MTNATAMILSPAYDLLSNSSNINIVKAALGGWTYSGEGIAAVFILSFIIILAGSIVYMRTNKAIPSALVMILLIIMEEYYQWLAIPSFKWKSWVFLTGIILMIIISIAVDTYKAWSDR